jgi:hypothetical protein
MVEQILMLLGDNTEPLQVVVQLGQMAMEEMGPIHHPREAMVPPEEEVMVEGLTEYKG